MYKVLFLILLLPSFLRNHENGARTTKPISIDSFALKVGTQHNSPEELEAKKQIERIAFSFPIKKWMFTDTVAIDSKAIPRSHPVLTLNTGYLQNDTAQLATFLHEQFHWMLAANRSGMQKTIQEFEKEFPGAPAELPQGARDQFSSYLHLIVCYLELESLKQLVGEASARRVLQGWKHYTWIYDKVLNDPRVSEINQANGWVAP